MGRGIYDHLEAGSLTASGDNDGYIAHFHEAFPPARARATHLKFFERTVRDLRKFVLDQDVIYVGGGSTANLLAIWRLHGLDRALRAEGTTPAYAPADFSALKAGRIACAIRMGFNIINEQKIISKGADLARPGRPWSEQSHRTEQEVRAAPARGSLALPATWAGCTIDTVPRPPTFRQSQITKPQSKRDVLHEALRGAPRISRGIYPTKFRDGRTLPTQLGNGAGCAKIENKGK